MKHTPLLLAVIAILSACQTENHPVVDYIRTNDLSPEEYVVSSFEDHDIIFIGENHYIKQEVEFVGELIPLLYEHGIYNLGTEFIRYSDTERMNKLITDSVYDEELARDITFTSLWHWGYQEYMDIYRKAWELNQSLPVGAPRFRIFGIEEDMDWSYVQSEADRQNPEIMAKVFQSSAQFEESEGLSAYAIEQEVLNKNEKALIHSGIHHAFTSYYQPNYNPETKGFGGRYEKERMGNLIKNKIGERTMTIFIHGPWYSNKGYSNQVLPVDGVLDSLFSIGDNGACIPFGADTRGTPLGDLKGKNSVYQFGYPDFTLKDFCDGYVFLVPINEYVPVTAIPGFVKPEYVDYIKSQEYEYRTHPLTAEDLNDSIEIWLDQDAEKYVNMK